MGVTRYALADTTDRMWFHAGWHTQPCRKRNQNRTQMLVMTTSLSAEVKNWTDFELNCGGCILLPHNARHDHKQRNEQLLSSCNPSKSVTVIPKNKNNDATKCDPMSPLCYATRLWTFSIDAKAVLSDHHHKQRRLHTCQMWTNSDGIHHYLTDS